MKVIYLFYTGINAGNKHLKNLVSSYIEQGTVGFTGLNLTPPSSVIVSFEKVPCDTWIIECDHNSLPLSDYPFDVIYVGENLPIGELPEWVKGASTVERVSIEQDDPIEKRVKLKERKDNLAQGFTWNNHVFQTRPEDLQLITGRVLKLLVQNALGVAEEDISWRTLDNQFYVFTPEEFLDFSLKLTEFVESVYVRSWVTDT